MNKSYCVLPWINVTTQPDGSIRPCCRYKFDVKKPDGSSYNLGKDKIEDFYNSPDYIELRTKMLAGEEIHGCSQCYDVEKYGGLSSRMTYNKLWSHKNFTTPIADPTVEYFDLRLGNMCNLSCRSCQPVNSSTLVKEIEEINNDDLTKYFPVYSDTTEWFTTDMFEDNVNGQLDNLKFLYLTGGEPTIVEKNMEILERLVSSGKSKGMRLQINSNMTNLKPKFYKLINEFNLVLFNASVDGYGEIQEYLRYPSKWSQIDANIKQLLNNRNIIIRPCPVIQTGNLNKLVDLFDYFESYNRDHKRRIVEILPMVLESPEQLDFAYLPKDFRKLCWDRINTWLKTKCRYQTPKFLTDLRSIRNKCLHEGEADVEKLRQFVEYNTIFDNHRNHHLKDVNTELYEVLQNTI